MSLRRVALIMGFDLRHRVLGWQGLLFLLPFALLWYPVMRAFQAGASSWLGRGEGTLAAAMLLDPQLVRSLFIEHSPTLSATFLIMLYSAPFFALLAGYDQFASDLGSGFLRFLVPRCRRVEIFAGRYLGTGAVLAVAYAAVATIAAWIALQTDQQPRAEIVVYAFQVLVVALLYLAPLISLAALASSLARSAIGGMFFAMAGYVALHLLILAGKKFLPGAEWWPYLLSTGTRLDIIRAGMSFQSLVLASLPLYALAYGWLAWRLFQRRNF